MAADRWQELESDPGLFTLLVGDFGVLGVRVEEIYDVSKVSSMEDVYGFIFLFKMAGESSMRRKRRMPEEEAFVTDPSIVNNMFFATQIIPNSCASHALLSVLLNSTNVSLGPVLEDLKSFSKGMDPESKGQAIGKYPHLARTHDNHAKPNRLKPLAKGQMVVSSAATQEAFHYSSFVPISGRLYEMDGLKPYPVDHGEWTETERWTAFFQLIIQRRLNQSKDICFNLMAVVRDPLQDLVRTVERQQQDLRLTLTALARLAPQDDLVQSLTTRLVKVEPIPVEHTAVATAIQNVLDARSRLEESRKELACEQEVRQGYLLDHARRTHDYNPAIQEFIKALARHGQLPVSVVRKNSKQFQSGS